MKSTCKTNNHNALLAVPLNFLDLGEGPLSTILSFLPLRDVASLACVHSYCWRFLVQQEYQLRDVAMDEMTKSRAATPQKRLQRWAVATAQCDAAAKAWERGVPAVPSHVALDLSPSCEIMLRLYSICREKIIWQGFLPCQHTSSSPNNNSQGSASGWQLDVTLLRPVWAQLVKPLTSLPSPSMLECVSQIVEDLVVTLVLVGKTGAARLVTCTQGVALSQRQHGVQSPSTFVLRQQKVAGLPIVVHVALKAEAQILNELNVSYFCVR